MTPDDGRRATLQQMVAADPQRLRRRSLSLGVPFSDADDVAQNALLRAWRSIEQLESPEPGQMCSWLDVIARNAASDLARLTVRRPADELDGDIPDVSDVADETVTRQLLDGALRAIHALPVSLRDPLLLSVVDGLSAIEIAQRLDTTPAAVRQRIARARKSLAACKESGMSEHA
ncbi:RNA polymerase ECF family sigma subunit [Microterricola gilva]|uniref:RNA polymerase ECF family sigma subunit n=1 Tax=Microterricola gilva TaxID=393267 RepID=A0A4Q8AM88_9MICO|nr:RNA polymerase sigma factor [Microterricola gilva]RZU65608.1 RNA polymerase ECF family sigma subunit [Microterricola gilva]